MTSWVEVGSLGDKRRKKIQKKATKGDYFEDLL
jgi:hypothetical protein